MALKVDKVQLEIILKSDSARKQIIDLEDEMKSLTSELSNMTKGLRGEQKELVKQSQAYQDLQKQITLTQTRIKDLRKGIDLNAMSLKELRARQRELSATLNVRTDVGSIAYKNLRTELVAVNARMRELRVGAQATQKGLGGIFDKVNRGFTTFTLATGAVTGLSLAFRKLASDAAHMDDVYSDVMKTTELSHDAVLELNEEFKKMDTRTSREQLNYLARDAGKLGIKGKKDILDFVEASNQINVALGEDLGEGAIKNIGKLIDVFKRSTTELNNLDLRNQMLSVGSAINALGQSSTASEGYLVSFAQRLGGVAAQSGISIQNILGYASALDQSGQQVEMSATAMQKFIMKLLSEPAMFAKMAGLEVSKFNDLLKTDTNAAIRQVLTALSEKGGFQALIPIFKDMKLDGARAVGVLSALATNIDKVDEAQKISNEEFSKATSLTNEYNVKNDNLQARLEKAKNAFANMAEEVGKELNPVLLKSTNIITYIIKLLPSLFRFVNEHKVMLISLVSALALYYTKQLAVNVVTKAWNTLLGVGRVAVLAYNGAIALMSGNTTRAAASWKLLNSSMNTNVFVAIASAVIALGIALYKLTRSTDESKKALKEFNEESYKSQNEANNLFNALKKTNEQSDLRKKLIAEINRRYGEYLPNLLSEKSSLLEIAAAQFAVNRALSRKVAIQTRDKAMAKIIEKNSKKLTSATEDLQDAIAERIGDNSAMILMQQIQYDFNKNGNDFKKGFKDANASLESMVIGSYDAYHNLIEYTRVLQTIAYQQEKVKNTFAPLVGEEIILTDYVAPKKSDNNDNDDNDDDDDDDDKTKKTAAKAAAKRAEELKKILADTQARIEIETNAYNERLKAAGLFGKKLSEMDEAQRAEQLRIEDDFQNKLAAIARTA
ncbi:MAG: phage tail tape measure protein, partial [Prevotellaceae bacterium]|nr:phage tail tape measure protein [Prevotellaceae bacterium]